MNPGTTGTQGTPGTSGTTATKGTRGTSISLAPRSQPQCRQSLRLILSGSMEQEPILDIFYVQDLILIIQYQQDPMLIIPFQKDPILIILSKQDPPTLSLCYCSGLPVTCVFHISHQGPTVPLSGRKKACSTPCVLSLAHISHHDCFSSHLCFGLTSRAAPLFLGSLEFSLSGPVCQLINSTWHSKKYTTALHQPARPAGCHKTFLRKLSM